MPNRSLKRFFTVYSFAFLILCIRVKVSIENPARFVWNLFVTFMHVSILAFWVGFFNITGEDLYIAIKKLGVTKACILSAICFGIYHWFSHEVIGNPVQMMKDWGIYSGCFLGAVNEIDKVGSLSKFEWWQIFFIIVLFIMKSIGGGILGALFEVAIKQFKILWSGKTKQGSLFLEV